MPQKGRDGRALSGAEKRRLKREREGTVPADGARPRSATVAAPASVGPPPTRSSFPHEDTSYRSSPAPATASDPVAAPGGWGRLLARIGEPPMNPLGNAEWANNAAAALAHLALSSKFSDALERQIKLCMRLVDRISTTQAKAIITREIRELQERAGIKQAQRPDADRLAPVQGGVTLRAAGRAVARK